jgi:lipopolysaccharide transport system ATP-binding protein
MGTVVVENLGKAFKHYRSRWDRLAEWVSPRGAPRHEQRWILRGLDFAVQRGETVGIVGRNGAGKSTLLKLLTGTMLASEGRAQVHGRVAALLELGMGFHGDFTGSQNAVVAGQLMGLQQSEVVKRLPEIAAFAEIGKAMDEPLRTYSSGMQMRLAFSVATAVEPEILIVDEALSVGDAYFQHKCFRRIREFKRRGVTLLFVSHDPLAVKSLCDRAILIEGGRIALDASPDQVLDYYNALIALDEAQIAEHEAHVSSSTDRTRSGDGRLRIATVELVRGGCTVEAMTTGETVTIRVRFDAMDAVADITAGFLIRDRVGNEIFGTNTKLLGTGISPVAPGETRVVDFQLPACPLAPGSYNVSVALHSAERHLDDNYDWWDHALTFEVHSPELERDFSGVVRLQAGATVRAEDVSRPDSLAVAR